MTGMTFAILWRRVRHPGTVCIHLARRSFVTLCGLGIPARAVVSRDLTLVQCAACLRREYGRQIRTERPTS